MLNLDIERKLGKIGGKGVDKANMVTSPSATDIEEAVDYEVQKQINEIRNETLLIGLREKYGHNIIRFMWVYFCFTTAAIGLNAAKIVQIDESTLNAMIGGTAVSVLGVVGTVAAGLFRAAPPKSD
jgi:hypothetical protein